MNSMMTRTALLFTIGLGLTMGCHASFKASANGQSNSANDAPAPPPKPKKATAPKTTAADKSAGTTQTSKIQLKGGKLNMPGNLVFDTGMSTLSSDPANEAVLEELRLFLTENPKVTVLRIEGHTDNVGDEASNMELSGNRALTVKNWLIGKGIAAERLLAVGFGDARPIADNSTEAGRAQNRRTEFKVAGWEGKKYMGKDPSAGGKVFGAQ